MRRFILCVMVCIAIVFFTNAVNLFAQTNKSEIDIVSLSIEKTGGFFVNRPETLVMIKLTIDQDILKIDSKKSELITFVDDQGTNLLNKGIKWRRAQSYFSSGNENGIHFENTEIDSNTAMIPIGVTAIPTRNSKTIQIEANITLYCYPSENSAKSTTDLLDLPDVTGEIVFSGFTAKIYDQGTGSIGGVPLNFFKVDTDAVIDKMFFYDIQERELKVLQYPGNFEIESNIVSDIKKVKIEYSAPVIVEVPLDIKTGIGI